MLGKSSMIMMSDEEAHDTYQTSELI
jgi:hypothetical protein